MIFHNQLSQLVSKKRWVEGLFIPKGPYTRRLYRLLFGRTEFVRIGICQNPFFATF